MITDCFDDKTEPVISLRVFYGEQKHLVETCLILFSQKIYQHLLDTFPSERSASSVRATGISPFTA